MSCDVPTAALPQLVTFILLAWMMRYFIFILLHSLSYLALLYARKANITSYLNYFFTFTSFISLNCRTKYWHSVELG